MDCDQEGEVLGTRPGRPEALRKSECLLGGTKLGTGEGKKTKNPKGGELGTRTPIAVNCFDPGPPMGRAARVCMRVGWWLPSPAQDWK